MKRNGRFAILSAAFLVNGVVWGTMAGCSGDDSGNDAGDASNDNTQPDSNKPDVNPGDVNQPDVNDGEASTPPFDASLLVQFQQNFANTYCTTIAKACFNEELDSGVPDGSLGTCTNLVINQALGIESAVYDLADPNALNGGHISINQGTATSCLAGLATMSLPSIPGSEYDNLAINCTGALVGDLPNGAGCHETAECQTGFCTYDLDAGIPDGSSGVCVPTGVAGTPCGSDRGAGNEECMHRSWQGTNQLRCDFLTASGAPGTMKCIAKFANGSDCSYLWDCQTGMCDYDNTETCVANSTTFTYISPGTCNGYFPDAGF